jgi:adenosylcobinamide-GDP ribazoletransferase
MPPLVYETVAWLRFYTHLPLPPLPGESEPSAAPDPLRTAQAVPIAGALIGAAGGLVLIVFVLLGASAFVAAAAAVLALIAVTAGRPEHSLAAFAERLAGGAEHHSTLAGIAERFRHHGRSEASVVTVYGVLAIVLAALLRTGSVETLTMHAAVAAAFVLIGAGAVSRAAATSFALIRPAEGEASADQTALQWLVATGPGIGIVTVLPGFGIGATIAGLAAAVGAAALLTSFAPRANSDERRAFAGTVEIVAEVAFLVAVVAFARIP